MFKPRPKQAAVLAYRGGKMGVSAVPGSGKTATLAYLAAQLVAQGDLADDQEVLIVTLVKSAVGNFSKSLATYLKEEFDLLPGFGYRVRTLHGLANDIVRERPALAGLADDFTVLDERAADDILQDAVDAWVRTHPTAPDSYLSDDHYANAYTRNTHWGNTVKAMANNFIRQAKDMQCTVADVDHLLKNSDRRLPLAEMCTDIYEQYERSLQYRGAIDFQDLIRLALHVLKADHHYLARLRHRFPYVLEDEAQDSSKLQEDILRLLVGDAGNWVRVGDPNQAIYETFTTADPKYLRDFLEEPDVQARTLPNSGRSSLSIIKVANQLIRWSLEHPHPAVRAKRPLTPPYIEPTPPDDPQGNPPDDPHQIHLRPEKYTGDSERGAIVRSLQNWLPDHPTHTCAVLLPINSSGAKMVQALRDANIDYVENLKSTSSTRKIVGALLYVIKYLENPKHSANLAAVYRVWRRDERGDDESERQIDNIAKGLRKIKRVEDYLHPRIEDWLDEQADDNDSLRAHLDTFRTIVRRWQAAADLPIDQLLLTIGADIFHTDHEIATAYSVALYLRRFAEQQPDAQLPAYTAELRAIASGKRSFSGMGDDDDAFDPDQHPGKVTVTTMHKAKGLEWDRVYIMAANNYNYPSGDVFDNFIGEKWFLRDDLNLEAEARAQLDALVTQTPYQEGAATEDARVEYVAERLRLLYVGITRAKRELIITWNTGRKGEQVTARPVTALYDWWQGARDRQSSR